MNRHSFFRVSFATTLLLSGLGFLACVGDDQIPVSPNATNPDATTTNTSDSPTGTDGPSTTNQDTGIAQDGDLDAGKVCSPLDPFDPPALLGGVNQSGLAVNGARLSEDERTIYYGSSKPPAPGPPAPIDELLFATRSGTTQPFSSINPLLTDPNFKVKAANATVTLDQKTLFFNTTGFDFGSSQISIATRVDPSTAFGTAAQVSFVGGVETRAGPYVNADATRLYYEQGSDIYVATKQGSSYADILPLLTHGSGTSFSNPVLSSDELTMWLSRTTSTERKVYVTQRKSLDLAFDTPTIEVTALNALGPARPTWISKDLCSIYVTIEGKINPPMDTGTFKETHIYRATRQPK